MHRYYVHFDVEYRSKKTRKTYYESECESYEPQTPWKDKSLHWFHEGYGRMILYRLHKVDDENFVAEKTGKSCYTCSEKWQIFSAHPELALA